MVSGRYFFPKAPVLCLKWMPAVAVTSVNSMRPEGRTEVASGLGAGDAGTGVGADGTDGADSAAGFDETVSGTFDGCCLQPADTMSVASARQHTTLLRSVKIFMFPFNRQWATKFAVVARRES